MKLSDGHAKIHLGPLDYLLHPPQLLKTFHPRLLPIQQHYYCLLTFEYTEDKIFPGSIPSSSMLGCGQMFAGYRELDLAQETLLSTTKCYD